MSFSTNVRASPKDAMVMDAILRDSGIADYEPRVINQMLEFAYRYTADVLNDAKGYSDYCGKSTIDADDVKLAIQNRSEASFSRPPPRELLMELSKAKNSAPIPPIKQQYGLRLPPDRYCLLQPNYRLKSAHALKLQTGPGQQFGFGPAGSGPARNLSPPAPVGGWNAIMRPPSANADIVFGQQTQAEFMSQYNQPAAELTSNLASQSPTIASQSSTAMTSQSVTSSGGQTAPKQSASGLFRFVTQPVKRKRNETEEDYDVE